MRDVLEYTVLYTFAAYLAVLMGLIVSLPVILLGLFVWWVL
jgi:prolipoprotein diacylglyceryltransferase